jgi:predicted neuraminidase
MTSRAILLGVFFVLFGIITVNAADRPTQSQIQAQPGYVSSEFIYEDASAPTPECHASTIEFSDGDLFASWFGGTCEGKDDVCIWVSRKTDALWGKPIMVADGVWTDGKRYPTWNPVLFQPKDGPLKLFYKVGPNPRDWWGTVTEAADGDFEKSKKVELPEGFLGPIKNKPIQLDDGTIISPTSTEHKGWKAHFELSPNSGKNWLKTEPVADPNYYGPIQPTILKRKNGSLLALNRTLNGRKIAQTFSTDQGKTWSQLEQIDLPNPNSGIDAVTLSDGRHLLVYNHSPSKKHSGRSRSILNLAVSDDDGKSWKATLLLEEQPGEFSYPAIIQTPDGLVHITYTFKRKKVKHVVVDPAKLILRDMVEGNWPEPYLTPSK